MGREGGGQRWLGPSTRGSSVDPSSTRAQGGKGGKPRRARGRGGQAEAKARARACEQEAMSDSEEPRLGAHATSRTYRVVGLRLVAWLRKVASVCY